MDCDLVFRNQKFFDFAFKSAKFAHFSSDLALNFAKQF